ncbi:MAG: hypothetical protein OHK0056_20630 [Bacteriovoracaceae bacterium]
MKWICFLILSSVEVMAAPKPHLYRPTSQNVAYRAYEIELYGKAWQSSGTYDNEGALTPFEDGQAYQMLEEEITLRYAYGMQLEMRGGIRFRQNTSETATTSVSSSGMESYFVGAKYATRAMQKMMYAFDISYRGTSYSNTDYQQNQTVDPNELVLGDEGQEITLGFHMAYYRTNDHILSGSLSYRSPGNDLSSETPYHIESAWLWDQWALIVGGRGVNSLKNDEFSDVPNQKPRQATGSSALYNSINRSWFEPYVGINYAGKSFKFGVEGGQRLNGVSTDQGLYAAVSLTFTSGGKSMDELKREKFKEYSVEASIVKVSARGTFVQIDQGMSSDIEKGMKFDIYKADYFGNNELVAGAICYELASGTAILKITKRYSQTPIEKGMVARGY